MNINLSIKNRLILGFGGISIVLVIIFLFTIFKLNEGKTLTEKNMYVYSPAVQNVEQLGAMVLNLNYLTKNWVFIEHQANTPDKLFLKKTIQQDYPLLKEKLLANAKQWNEENQLILERVLISIDDSLFDLENTIMTELSTFESYEDDMTVFFINPMLEKEGEFSLLIQNIQYDINLLDAHFQTYNAESAKTVIESLKGFQLIMFILLVIGAIVIIGVSYYTIRSITIPIYRLKKNIIGKSEGNFVRIVSQIQDDEIGDMSTALNAMSDNIKSIINTIKNSSETLNQSSEKVADSASAIANGAGLQAAASEQVSSSMEEMTASITKNSENSKETEDLTTKVVTNLKIISKSVGQTTEAMNDIIKKVSAVNEIAERIDLLAINASIEAARAGEYGRGFSVVANEIRKLAERSQKTSTDINSVSKSSVSIADRSNKLLVSLLPDVEKTLSKVQEISHASFQQKAGINVINDAINELSNVTLQNASASEELSESSNELINQAKDLNTEIEFFKTTEADLIEEKSKETDTIEDKEESKDDTQNKVAESETTKEESEQVSKVEPKKEVTNPVIIDLNKDDDGFEKY